MIAIVNYGLGNLHSVHKAVVHVGGDAVVTDDVEVIRSAEKVVLPGVGAFGDGMQGLEERGLIPVIKEIAQKGTPLLGICLGMQLLFDTSTELGSYRGLGLIPGEVVLFEDVGVKVPQIGWNQLMLEKGSALLRNTHEGDYVYFNHSYYCVPAEKDDVLTSTEYGLRYCSAVQRGNILGVQFHPEKSQKVGLNLLKNFVEAV
ncbi:MAG: imidazole glycerol phosphate synthase subunit HisH [Anaerolineae bacterium]|jgi:glutamine amidotransferase|nr:imidazole glycerol phosphate synthase subunit HisH [Anaerolineae bacterium]